MCPPLCLCEDRCLWLLPMEEPEDWFDADRLDDASADAMAHSSRITAAQRGPALESMVSSDASERALSMVSGRSSAGYRCVDAVGHQVASTDSLYNAPVQNLNDCSDRVNLQQLGTTYAVCPMCLGVRCQECLEFNALKLRAEPAPRYGRVPTTTLCPRCYVWFPEGKGTEARSEAAAREITQQLSSARRRGWDDLTKVDQGRLEHVVDRYYELYPTGGVDRLTMVGHLRWMRDSGSALSKRWRTWLMNYEVANHHAQEEAEQEVVQQKATGWTLEEQEVSDAKMAQGIQETEKQELLAAKAVEPTSVYAINTPNPSMVAVSEAGEKEQEQTPAPGPVQPKSLQKEPISRPQVIRRKAHGNFPASAPATRREATEQLALLSGRKTAEDMVEQLSSVYLVQAEASNEMLRTEVIGTVSRKAADTEKLLTEYFDLRFKQLEKAMNERRTSPPRTGSPTTEAKQEERPVQAPLPAAPDVAEPAPDQPWCLRCGKPGHMVRECPQAREPSQESRPKAKAKAKAKQIQAPATASYISAPNRPGPKLTPRPPSSPPPDAWFEHWRKQDPALRTSSSVPMVKLCVAGDSLRSPGDTNEADFQEEMARIKAHTEQDYKQFLVSHRGHDWTHVGILRKTGRPPCFCFNVTDRRVSLTFQEQSTAQAWWTKSRLHFGWNSPHDQAPLRAKAGPPVPTVARAEAAKPPTPPPTNEEESVQAAARTHEQNVRRKARQQVAFVPGRMGDEPGGEPVPGQETEGKNSWLQLNDWPVLAPNRPAPPKNKIKIIEGFDRCQYCAQDDPDHPGRECGYKRYYDRNHTGAQLQTSVYKHADRIESMLPFNGWVKPCVNAKQRPHYCPVRMHAFQWICPACKAGQQNWGNGYAGWRQAENSRSYNAMVFCGLEAREWPEMVLVDPKDGTPVYFAPLSGRCAPEPGKQCMFLHYSWFCERPEGARESRQTYYEDMPTLDWAQRRMTVGDYHTRKAHHATQRRLAMCHAYVSALAFGRELTQEWWEDTHIALDSELRTAGNYDDFRKRHFKPLREGELENAVSREAEDRANYWSAQAAQRAEAERLEGQLVDLATAASARQSAEDALVRAREEHERIKKKVVREDRRA